MKLAICVPSWWVGRLYVLLLLILHGISIVEAAPIVIGQVVDQSGFDGDLSRDFVAGAQVYFDVLNSTGGINGRKVSLLVKDNAGDEIATLALSKDLVNKDKADLLFGYTGDANISALLSSPWFQQANIPLFGAATGLTVNSQAGNIYFTRASYIEEAQAIIDQFRLWQLESYIIVNAKTRAMRAVANEVGSILQKSGIRTVAGIEIDLTKRDYSQIAQLVVSKKPQVVIVVADTLTTAQFTKSYRQLNSGGWLAALSMVNPAVVLQLMGGDNAPALVITQVVPKLSPALIPIAIDHLKHMRKYRDEPPSPQTFEGYIAARALVQALTQINGDITPAKIAEVIKRSPRMQLGGVDLHFLGGNRGTKYADTAFLKKDGSLLR